MNKQHYKISVIIPYYNGSQSIERALDSVFEQTRLPDEVIIVDDGSRDIESKFLLGIKRANVVKIYRTANAGQAAARNYGVGKANADFISFLDQDDYYLPWHIEALEAEIPKKLDYFGYVYADLYRANYEGVIDSQSVLQIYRPKIKQRRFTLEEYIKEDLFILPSATLISKKAFLDVGGFDKQFMGYEDDDLFIRMFRRGYYSVFLDRAVTVWCIHSNSTSYGMKMVRSRYKFIAKLISSVEINNIYGVNYIEDLIIPRFNRLCLNEIMTHCLIKSEYLQELIESYESTIMAVKKKSFHIKLVLTLIKKMPKTMRFMIKIMKKALFLSY
jgi:glycosyltransferase involved in cell wall biosynthesis